MKYVLVAIVLLLSTFALVAQTPPAQEPRPGIAGHHSCRVYFGVMWLDGVPSGEIQQATHYGLSQQQFEWWTSEGYDKFHGACYLPQVRETTGKVELQCQGCAADWVTQFRWVVFEHVDAKDKRASVSHQVLTGQMGNANSSHPNTSMSVGDPRTRVDYEVEVVATGAAVYAASNPIRPPSGQDAQLFYHSEEKDKSHKDPEAQGARNDRVALQAAVGFIVKNVKR